MDTGLLTWLFLVLVPGPSEPTGCVMRSNALILVGAPGGGCGRTRHLPPHTSIPGGGQLRLRGGRREPTNRAAGRSLNGGAGNAIETQEDELRRELVSAFGDMKALSFPCPKQPCVPLPCAAEPFAEGEGADVQNIEEAGQRFLDGGAGEAADMLIPGSDISDAQVYQRFEPLAAPSCMRCSFSSCFRSAQCCR